MRTNIDLLETVTICIAPRSGFTVVTVDNILAVVGLVNTASLKSTVVFTAEHRHIRVLFSEIIVSMSYVVKACHIKNVTSTAVGCDACIHSTQKKTSGVKFFYFALKSFGKLSACRSALKRFFVKQWVHNNRRVVAVTHNHILHLLDAVGTWIKVTVFVHDKNTVFVTIIEYFWIRVAVSATVRIWTHFF